MSFCGKCGTPLVDADRFCTNCGAERPSPAGPSMVVARRAESRPPVIQVPASSEIPAVVERDPLTLPAHETGSHTREMALIFIVLLIALSGYCGYTWVSRPRPVAAGPLAPTPAAPGVPAADTTEEIAASRTWRTIPEFTRDVANESNALGDPDGRTATVLPGGTLALAYAGGDFFYNGPGPDVRVFGPEGDRTPYTVFAKTEPNGKWMRFDANRRGFSKGEATHDFGHHGLDRASQIMIRNDGPLNLYIDAVAPLYREPGEHHDDERPHK